MINLALAALAVAAPAAAAVEATDCAVPVSVETVRLTGYNTTTDYDWFADQEGDVVYLDAAFDFSESVRENMEILEAYPRYDSTEIFQRPLREITFPFPTVDWAAGVVAPTYLSLDGPDDADIEAYSMGILWVNVRGFYAISRAEPSDDMVLLTLTETVKPAPGQAEACAAMAAMLAEPMED